jgi:hypothetical protein
MSKHAHAYAKLPVLNPLFQMAFWKQQLPLVQESAREKERFYCTIRNIRSNKSYNRATFKIVQRDLVFRYQKAVVGI